MLDNKLLVKDTSDGKFYSLINIVSTTDAIVIDQNGTFAVKVLSNLVVQEAAWFEMLYKKNNP